MSACLQAGFETKLEAKKVSQKLRKQKLVTTFYRCDKCDEFHLRLNTRLVALPERRMQIMTFISLGYTTDEIAERLGVSVSTVDWNRWKLAFDLRANTPAHLVAIALCLGLIDPREHLPRLMENCTIAS